MPHPYPARFKTQACHCNPDQLALDRGGLATRYHLQAHSGCHCLPLWNRGGGGQLGRSKLLSLQPERSCPCGHNPKEPTVCTGLSESPTPYICGTTSSLRTPWYCTASAPRRACHVMGNPDLACAAQEYPCTHAGYPCNPPTPPPLPCQGNHPAHPGARAQYSPRVR